jgi:hypothetical protein
MKLKLLLSVIMVMAVAGCAGLTQIQDSVTKFDQGVHLASTAQMSFFRAVQVADCTNQFYRKTYEWAKDHKGNFDLTGTCQPGILTDDQITIRQALMDALTLYLSHKSLLVPLIPWPRRTVSQILRWPLASKQQS